MDELEITDGYGKVTNFAILVDVVQDALKDQRTVEELERVYDASDNIRDLVFLNTKKLGKGGCHLDGTDLNFNINEIIKYLSMSAGQLEAMIKTTLAETEINIGVYKLEANEIAQLNNMLDNFQQRLDESEQQTTLITLLLEVINFKATLEYYDVQDNNIYINLKDASTETRDKHLKRNKYSKSEPYPQTGEAE